MDLPGAFDTVDHDVLFSPKGTCWYDYHLYADDAQLCVSLDSGNNTDVSLSAEYLEHCIPNIQLLITIFKNGFGHRPHLLLRSLSLLHLVLITVTLCFMA